MNFAQPPAALMSQLSAEKHLPFFGFSMFGAGRGEADSQYRVLLESPVPGSLDLSTLARELASEMWTDDTLLVKALVDQGARNVAALPPNGQSREMKFQLNLGIPWDRLQTYSRMVGVADDTGPQRSSSFMDITARYNVYQTSDGRLIIQSSFVIPTPMPTLHLVFALKPGEGKGYVFAGAVEFPERGGRLLDNSVVQHFMELGFLQAAKRYGRMVLMELQRRARGGRQVAPSRGGAQGAVAAASGSRSGEAAPPWRGRAMERRGGGYSEASARRGSAGSTAGDALASTNGKSVAPHFLQNLVSRAQGLFRSSST